MAIKQVTVFIGNKEGRIEKVTEVLKENDINLCSLSLAESVDYGLLRLIVRNPEKAKDEEFKEKSDKLMKERFSVTAAFGIFRPLISLIQGGTTMISSGSLFVNSIRTSSFMTKDGSYPSSSNSLRSFWSASVLSARR